MKLLGTNDDLRLKIAGDPDEEPSAGGCPDHVDLLRMRLQAMMNAYERRIRSDCKSPAELAAQPWKCAEYVAAEAAMRETL